MSWVGIGLLLFAGAYLAPLGWPQTEREIRNGLAGFAFGLAAAGLGIVITGG